MVDAAHDGTLDVAYKSIGWEGMAESHSIIEPHQKAAPRHEGSNPALDHLKRARIKHPGLLLRGVPKSR